MSVLTAGTSIVLSYFNQKERSEKTYIKNIDNTLDEMQYIVEENNGGEYLDDLNTIIKYIDDIYTSDTEKKRLSDFETFHEYYDYQSALYPWIYDNGGGFGLSQEKAAFRNSYHRIQNLTTSAQYSSGTVSAFLAYKSADGNFVIICDSRSIDNDCENEFFHMAGTYYKFDDAISESENPNVHHDLHMDGYTAHFAIIKQQEEDGEFHPLAYIFIQYDLTTVRKESQRILTNELIILGLSSLTLVALYAVFSYLLFVRNINRLSDASAKIKEKLINKDLNKAVEVKVKANDEMKVLADSFNEMEKEIINYVDIIQKEANEREKINAELSVASKIQLDALPDDKFDDNKVSIRAFINPAKEVSGDFYDYFYIDDHRLAILISDVSGKGIPASLFMMKGKEMIKSALASSNSLEEAINRANYALSKNNKELLFITSFVGVIDFKLKEISYINAGQERPYIISNGKVIKLDGEANIVLGVEETYQFKKETHPFNEGDYIFMFTDGLNEAINESEEEFSHERIEACLELSKESSLEEVIENMNKSLEEFINGADQFDDVTILITKFNSNKLSLHYDKKDYEIITDIVDKFNNTFANLSEKIKGSTGIVIDELVNNLVSYEKREDLVIDVTFEAKEEGLHIVIASNGADYNPFDNHKEKYLKEFDTNIKEGGFGLSLIKDLAKSYSYEYKNKHSIINILVSD